MTLSIVSSPSPSDRMKAQSTFSPISLSYVAALRGHKPSPTGASFSYADALCTSPEKLICLAASNPEGRFYGMVTDEDARRTAETAAAQRGIFNVVFIAGKPSEILARVTNGSTLPPMLDYLCCDESEAALAPAERAALFDLAQKRLTQGGMFVTGYRAYDKTDGAMRFLVRELAPEMDGPQKQEFLTELKQLGSTYLAAHPEVMAKLNDAIAKQAPESFFDLFKDGAAASAGFDTMVAMGSRGMRYAGDAHLVSNYVELAVPAEAQALVVQCRTHVLYEQIKDLALGRTLRTDIWVKASVPASQNPAELFGRFAYGVIMAKDDIPPAFAARGKLIDLSSPLFVKLIDLMALMPIGIGDFLSHPTGKGEKPEKILEALQILVACGIASPMRGRQIQLKNASISQPRFVGSYNRYLDKTDLTGGDVFFASQVMGCGVSISGREALVMQALNRAGLSNSVSALMPELTRLAASGDAAMPIEDGELTAEKAQSMIRDVVATSLPQWYAYALLEAA